MTSSKILVDALNARGLHYAPVAVTTDFSVQGPGLFPDGFMNVQLTDRVAILARTDVPLTITDVQTGDYTHNTVISTLQGPITLTEGWASVDATLGHHTVRFVTTHLADNSAAVGSAQAAELVQGPAQHRPARHDDLRLQRRPRHGHLRRAHSSRAQGLLGCRPNPASPASPAARTPPCKTPCSTPTSALTSRIDYIFSRGGGLKATGDQVIGADPASRSVPGGFWSSDHAGLIAELAQGRPS